MDKMKMHSLDGVARNIEMIGKLFPNVMTEVKRNGKVEQAIDFDALKQELSNEIVEGREERYQFTWPDKQKAKLAANAPISATLRPVISESVGKDGTEGGFDSENLYIEGDNLDVLKALQETYLNKVKMIYIDPPYNTGNDFVYEDNFAQSKDEYMENSAQYDDEGNRMVPNLESNGRLHTDWLNMIYPRLKVARDLLADDGVIFISIGQDELENLLKLCDEIWGETNRLGVVSRQMKTGGGSQGKYFAHNVDYIIVYAKQYNTARYFRGKMSDELIKKVYNKVQLDGKRKGEYYRSMGLYQSSLGIRAGLRYYIECPDGTLVIPPGTTFPSENKEGKSVSPVAGDGRWRWSYDLYKERLANGDIEFKQTDNGILLDSSKNKTKWNIYTKIWLKDRENEGTIPSDLLMKFENRHSAKELAALGIPFEFSKVTELVKYLIEILNQDNDITVMDFFSGSATTAHAVMKLNAEDGGHRKFIMVQIPEKTPENSEARKAGFQTICDIGKERIRRAGQKIKEDAGLTVPADLDIGFRCLRLDSSNMKPVYYSPDAIEQKNLFDFVDNVKEDRSPEDLLFQVMLEFGVPLSSDIEVTDIAGKKVFTVSKGFLIACFDRHITDDTVTAIAKQKPTYVVFRDSSFADDSVAMNFNQIFDTYSPDTIRKVL